MKRLTRKTDKGILVKEDYGENALRTLYQCFDAEPNTHYTNCEEGYCAIEKLAAYEDLGVTPEQIKEFSSIYLDKCEEVNRLKADLAEYKKFEDSITFNHVLELIKAEENKLFEESKQPQGDLISREETLKAVSDEVEKLVEKAFYSTLSIPELRETIEKSINEQPTAYDVEKVVEQLDKNCFSPDNYPGYAVDAELAVDIVHAGGKE